MLTYVISTHIYHSIKSLSFSSNDIIHNSTLAMEHIRIETLRKLQNPKRSDSSTDNSHHSTPTNSTALEYTTTKKYHQTTSLYLDQPPSYEYPPTYEEARIIKKYYKFTLVGQ